MTKGKEMPKSLKLTAAVYATKPEVVEHVRKHGTLPEEFSVPGGPVAMSVIMRRRGTDLTLTEKEQLVYDAIIRSGRLPGGMVNLIEEIGDESETK